MKIVRLTLHKNKLLHLLPNDTFTLTPTNDKVVIRGTSGIGKSVILNELSPLPANHKEYEKGGYKEIEFIHLGKHYLLTCKFDSPNNYSFIENNEELNQSGNVTEQTQLCQTHFNYTKALHHILTGRTRFTQMSPSDRRHWFSQVSEGDAEFITKYWDAIRSGHRDEVGARKNTAAKIQEQTTNLADETKMQALNERADQCRTMLNKAESLTHHYPNVHPNSSSEKQLNDMLDEIYRRHTGIMEEVMRFQSKRKDQSDIDRMHQQSQQTIEQLQYQKTESLKKLETLQDDEQVANYKSRLDKTEVEACYLRTKEEFTAEKEKVDYARYSEFLKRERYDERTALLSEIKDDQFTERFLTMLYRVEPVSFETMDTFTQRMEELKQGIGKTEIGVTRLTSEYRSTIEHLSELSREPEHTCPKCQHVFRTKTITERIEELSDKKNILIERLKKGEAQLTQLKEEYENHQEQYSQWHSMMGLIYKDHYRFTQLGRLINVPEMTTTQFFKDISKYQSLIPPGIEMLQSWIQMSEVEHRYEKAKEDYAKYNDGSESAIQLKLNLIKEEEQRQDTLTQEIGIQIALRNHLGELIDQRNQIKDSHQRLLALIDNVFMLINGEMKHQYLHALNEMKYILSTELTEIEKVLSHQNGLQYITNHLKSNLAQIDNNIDTHKRLMSILNPKDGLIAKSVTGFIKHFIKEMNSFIKQVWSYQFYIDVESEEVNFTKDYKFPVVIGDDHTGQSPDVFYTSTGQSEIIDVAYRFVLMKYAKIVEWPLYADELGSNLNPLHRDMLYNLLKRMHDENRLSQLFIITHLNDIETMMGISHLVNLES